MKMKMTRKKIAPKYELDLSTELVVPYSTDADGNPLTVTLHRIRALRNIPGQDSELGDYAIETGDIGGWVESENNLKHTGHCWIYDDAMAFGHGLVSENAVLRGTACVRDYAVVNGNTRVLNATIRGNALVTGHASILGAYIHKDITGLSYIFKPTFSDNGIHVSNHAVIADHAELLEFAHVDGSAVVRGHAVISNEAVVFGRAYIEDDAMIYDNAHVGSATIRGNAHIGKDADIHNSRDYLTLGPLGDFNDFITAYACQPAAQRRNVAIYSRAIGDPDDFTAYYSGGDFARFKARINEIVAQQNETDLHPFMDDYTGAIALIETHFAPILERV